MSGRRRRSESLWDRKEDSVPQTEISEKIPSNFHRDGSPKRSNSEGNDILMSDDFSRQQSREPMDNERHRMKMDPALDEWENQYSSRPSDDSYNIPYRSHDRGVVPSGTENMSKDRDLSRSRSRSPHRNRGRDRDRGQGRPRSPFRGGASRLDNDYSSGSRFQDDRNVADNPRGKGSDGYRKDNARNEARDYPRKDNARNEEARDYPRKDNARNEETRDYPRKDNARNEEARDYPRKDNARNEEARDYPRKDNARNEEPRDYPRKDNNARNEEARDYPRKDNARSEEARDYQRKDNARNEEARDYPRSNRSGYDDHDHRRQSNQSVKTPCRFFIMGNCNRSNCKFSHDPPTSGGYERRSHDNIPGSNSGDNNPWIEDHAGFSDFPNAKPNFDDKNKSWNHPSWNNVEAGGFDELDIASNRFPATLNGNGDNLQSNGSVQGILSHLDLQNETVNQNKEDEKLKETFKNDQVMIGSTDQAPQNVILANALNLLHSLPNPADSTVVNEPVKTNVPPEVKVTENLEKAETQGKVDEGYIGNDENAMRQFKIALVEFVKEILKPAWKEGKMNKEDYKTIVKKVVEKVTSTIQGIQIPRTQEKIDQYLAFSKSKITKLVEAYVGRFQKA